MSAGCRPQLRTCCVCAGSIVLRSDVERPRRSDGSWSQILQGWICFGCQSEAKPADVDTSDEPTEPNVPNWHEELIDG